MGFEGRRRRTPTYKHGESTPNTHTIQVDLNSKVALEKRSEGEGATGIEP
jgi:hypothetical protein